MGATKSIAIVATGAVAASPTRLWSVGLSAGTVTAASLVVQQGENGGTICKLSAPISGHAQRVFLEGVLVSAVYATFVGTSPVGDFEVDL